MADSPTQFFLQEIATRVGPLALVTMDNGEDWQKPNVFGRAALESLHDLLPRLREGDFKGLVLTGKPFVFAAGADLSEFHLATTPELARAGGKGGHDVFAGIRDLPFPTLAAINGAALGGGLEIALHCDFRTLARSVRHIGFPEVFLGIIPAWGGTQLLPRVVGAKAAVELIVANPLKQNRMLRADQAAELGLADALLDDVEFLDDSIEWLVRAIEEGRTPREDADLSDAPEVCAKATLRGRRRRPRRRARALPGARPDRRHGNLHRRGRLRPRGGRARRPPPGPAGAGRGLRLRPDRAADQERCGNPGREAAPDPEGRRRRRRPDGDAARHPVPAPPRGAPRDHRRRCRTGRGGGRRDPRRSREAGVEGTALGGQGALPRLDRQRCRRHLRLRGLRPRDRGGVRGDRRQATGLRRARAGRLGGVPARHEHLVSLGHADGGEPRASRARRRHALLQPRRRPPARRARPRGGHRRHRRSRPPGT